MLPGLADQQEFYLDGWTLNYQPAFLESPEADELLARLMTQRDWRQPRVRLYGKSHPVPRMLKWEGDAGVCYRYTGLVHSCSGWQPALEALRDRLARSTGRNFNFALLNHYRDGRDAMGWHQDNEQQLGACPWVASISLGAERDFHLKGGDGKTHSLCLEHGSLLLMPGRIAHQLPRRAAVSEPRINISFRQVITNTNQNVNHY